MKKSIALTALSATILVLSGCASTLNTASNSTFGCGLPKGQTCKTPTAVYNSTHGTGQQTQYDTPVGNNSTNTTSAAAKDGKDASTQGGAHLVLGGHIHSTVNGPRPVREPAQIVRIWIAPWVDASDTLHLAQYQFAEVQPRTWTVGLEEKRGGGYVIPHLALSGIKAVTASPNDTAASGVPAQATQQHSGTGMTSDALEAINNATRGVANSTNPPR